MNQLQLDDEAIFHVARGIEAPEARAAYLAQVCGADRGLQGGVDALLSAYDRERSFLESPPVDSEGTTTAAWQSPAERPGTVIVAIMTDGLENASKEWNGAAIKKLVEQQTSQWGWQFMYLGADQDAVEVGTSLGVPAAQSMTYARGKGREAMGKN